jgi:hypothetical protein
MKSLDFKGVYFEMGVNEIIWNSVDRIHVAQVRDR